MLKYEINRIIADIELKTARTINNRAGKHIQRMRDALAERARKIGRHDKSGAGEQDPESGSGAENSRTDSCT